MSKQPVYLRWYGDTAGATVVQAAHLNAKDALAQAAAEPGKVFLGVFDGPDPQSAKVADVPA